MIRTAQPRSTPMVPASAIAILEMTLSPAEQLARLKSKLRHPAFDGDAQKTRRAQITAKITELEEDICWSLAGEQPATPSELLPIRR